MSAEAREAEPATLAGATCPAVFISNGCGDHFLALPTLRALIRIFHGRLRLLCDPGAAETFFYALPFAQVIEVETWRGERGRRFDAAEVAARLGECDLLLSLNPWHGVAVDELLARLSPRDSIGFFPGFGLELPRDYRRHSADLVFSLVETLAPRLEIQSFADPPRFAAGDEEVAARILSRLPDGASLLAVHADTSAAKSWPAERFGELLDLLLDRFPNHFAFVLGVRDVGFERLRNHQRIVSALGLSIPVSSLLLASAELFVGVDSCFLHAADLLRTPAVGLFGPTDPAEWGLRFGPGEIVREGASMRAIEVPAVLAAARRVLAGR